LEIILLPVTLQASKDLNLAAGVLQPGYYITLSARGNNTELPRLQRPEQLRVEANELFLDDQAVREASYIVMELATFEFIGIDSSNELWVRMYRQTTQDLQDMLDGITPDEEHANVLERSLKNLYAMTALQADDPGYTQMEKAIYRKRLTDQYRLARESAAPPGVEALRLEALPQEERDEDEIGLTFDEYEERLAASREVMEVLRGTAHAKDDLTSRQLDAILYRLEHLEGLIVAGSGRGYERNVPDEESLDAVAEQSCDIAHSMLALEATGSLSSADQLEKFIDGLGLTHFKGREFTPYWSRIKNNVSNSVPPKSLWPNIARTLVLLDRFRSEIGVPVRLLSTYRDFDYNKAIGGAGGSMHMEFRAIDFTCASGTPASWAQKLRGYRGQVFRDPHTGDDFRFRGGIGVYPNSHFVHIDTRGNDADWQG